MLLSISLLFFDCQLTAIQDRDFSSGDHEDVIVKSEIIETEMMSGIVMPVLPFKFSTAKSLHIFL